MEFAFFAENIFRIKGIASFVLSHKTSKKEGSWSTHVFILPNPIHTHTQMCLSYTKKASPLRSLFLIRSFFLLGGLLLLGWRHRETVKSDGLLFGLRHFAAVFQTKIITESQIVFENEDVI